ncbi:MAG: hypothetical protein VYC39_09890 [Myxococcota bacterium]|nr:hypothetical protein [Myxococcota bacterium]
MSTLSIDTVLAKVRSYILVTGRFQLLRRALWSFLALDVLVTIIYIFIASGPSQETRVWFEVGVPANVLMINTFSDEEVTDVAITLDNKFLFEQTRLPAKTSGFPIDSYFRAQDGTRPPDNYRPKEVVLEIKGERRTIDLR